MGGELEFFPFEAEGMLHRLLGDILRGDDSVDELEVTAVLLETGFDHHITVDVHVVELLVGGLRAATAETELAETVEDEVECWVDVSLGEFRDAR